jgi:hypothetical protein
MISITSNGCNQPLDMGDIGTAPLNRSIYGRNLENSETNCHTTCITDLEDDDYKYRTRSIECNDQPKHLQWVE